MKPDHAKLLNNIFNCQTDFSRKVEEVFQFQYKNNVIYRKFADLIEKPPHKVGNINELPFLPIELFKNHKVYTSDIEADVVFKSSGTTTSVNSRHYIADVMLYERSFMSCFQKFYGNPKQYVFLALLPSYLEKGDSSLVYMCNKLIQESGSEMSGFYLHEHEKLFYTLQKAKGSSKTIFLIGVTFALLDFLEKFKVDLSGHIVLESGGMKGRRREMIREELHQILTAGFGVGKIHSEYGMTELLSQAYSKGEGIFDPPCWMKVLVRDAKDPLSMLEEGETGALNVIDLANVYSCSFIATSDLGRVFNDGRFEVLGRMDNSEIRGCSLLIA